MKADIFELVYGLEELDRLKKLGRGATDGRLDMKTLYFEYDWYNIETDSIRYRKAFGFKREDVKAAVEWLLLEIHALKVPPGFHDDVRYKAIVHQTHLKIHNKIKEAFPDVMEDKL